MHRDPPFISFCRDESAVLFFAQRHHVLKTMLGDIEKVAVRVRAAGLGVGAAKVSYLFMLRERELSNHRATFKTIPGLSDGLNDLNPRQRMR
jgi:hypothetical protein